MKYINRYESGNYFQTAVMWVTRCVAGYSGRCASHLRGESESRIVLHLLILETKTYCGFHWRIGFGLFPSHRKVRHCCDVGGEIRATAVFNIARVITAIFFKEALRGFFYIAKSVLESNPERQLTDQFRTFLEQPNCRLTL